MDWESKIQVQKGTYGEKLVDDYLQSAGYITYAPSNGGAHPIDRMVSSPDKQDLFGVEIKTKPRRMYYPDNGINLSHYRDYKKIETDSNIKILLFFVDQLEREIYGNTLSKLEAITEVMYNGKRMMYPKYENTMYGEIVYFPLGNTISVCSLKEMDAEQLKKLSSIRSDYQGAC